MRTLVFVAAAALVMSVQMIASAKAQDTTVIKRNDDTGQTTIIKKHEDRPFVAMPGTDKKVIIRKDRDDD